MSLAVKCLNSLGLGKYLEHFKHCLNDTIASELIGSNKATKDTKPIKAVLPKTFTVTRPVIEIDGNSHPKINSIFEENPIATLCSMNFISLPHLCQESQNHIRLIQGFPKVQMRQIHFSPKASSPHSNQGDRSERDDFDEEDEEEDDGEDELMDDMNHMLENMFSAHNWVQAQNGREQAQKFGFGGRFPISNRIVGDTFDRATRDPFEDPFFHSSHIVRQAPMKVLAAPLRDLIDEVVEEMTNSLIHGIAEAKRKLIVQSLSVPGNPQNKGNDHRMLRQVRIIRIVPMFALPHGRMTRKVG